jgi:aminoglycoside phosphotransferase (APT) family kinase protein
VAALGKPIGRGRTAEVFAWGDGRVLKLFYAGAPETSVERETAAAAAVTAAGLPAPRFFGREDVDGRAGLVFERADGPSLLTTLSKQPWRALELAATFAQLHASIHAASAELPSQRGYLRRQIERVDGLPDALLRRTLDVLDRLPDGLSACHFDFHPDNVVLTARGPIVLDWVTGVRGVPAADVARTLLILRDAVLPDDIPRSKATAFELLRRVLAWAYFRRYRALTGLTTAELHPWRRPLIVARLRENVPAKERARFQGEAEAALRE